MTSAVARNRLISHVSWAALGMSLSLSATAMAEDSAGDAQGEVVEAANIDFGDSFGPIKLPLEEVLLSFARQAGFSIIVDSRLLRGRFAYPVEVGDPPERQLRERLAEERLELRRIDDSAFAITQAQPAVAAPVAGTSPPTTTAQAPFVDMILVTASLGDRDMFGVDNRLVTLDAGVLDLYNESQPAETIYELPQSLATLTSANSTIYGPAAGLNLADLRGFGPERTLVTLNGRRAGVTPGGNGTVVGVDLTSFAQPFLERIEVIDQSAMAGAGPEAVAGLINFVTRRDIDGLEAGVRYGISERGDAQEISAHLIGGARLLDDRLSLVGGLQVAFDDGLLGGDRASTGLAYGRALEGRASTAPAARLAPGFGGSPVGPDGFIAGAIDANGNFVRTPAAVGAHQLDGAGGVEKFEGRADQLFNPLTEFSTITPADRAIGMFSAQFEIEPETTLFFDAYYGHSSTESLLAAAPLSSFFGPGGDTGGAAVAPLDGGTTPDAVRDFAEAAFGADARALVIERRFVEVGPRRSDFTRRYANLYAGVERKADALSLEAYYRFSRADTQIDQFNRVNLERMQTSLDPLACAATPGCAPSDLFRRGGVSPAAADFIRMDGVSRRIGITEHEGFGRASGDLASPLPGDIGLSGSLSIRRAQMSYVDTSSEDSASADLARAADARGGVTVAEAALSVGSRLLEAAPLIGDVDARIDYRLTGASAFGALSHVDAQLKAQPFDGLQIEGGIADGRRAPNVIELFFVGDIDELFFVDPCGDASALANATVAANCASGGPLGVAPGFTQTTFTTVQGWLGNPDLEAERVRAYNFGVSLRPDEIFETFPGRLALGATWSAYRISNTVGIADDHLFRCYASVGFSDPACGVSEMTGAPLIARDPMTQQIVNAQNQLRNGGEFHWRGLDLEARYAFEPVGWGPVSRIWATGFHTYVDRTTFRGVDETGSILYPRHRSLVSLGAEFGGLDVSALLHRRGRASDEPSRGPDFIAPAYLTADVSVRARLGESAQVVFSVENIADREPPIVAVGQRGQVFAEHYDIVGRRFAVSLKAAF